MASFLASAQTKQYIKSYGFAATPIKLNYLWDHWLKGPFDIRPQNDRGKFEYVNLNLLIFDILLADLGCDFFSSLAYMHMRLG